MGIAERKEREKQKRRQEILEAAERIFFSENADKGTMDDVADTVELSKGTLYLYFKNKTDLLYAISEKGVALLVQNFTNILGYELSGKAQLSDIGDEFVRFVEEYPRYFELIMQFELNIQQTESKGESKLLMEPALNVLRQIIIKGQADGTIRHDFTVDEIVIILWSQMSGLMQSILRKERYIEHYKLDIKQLIKGHYRIIMKGLTHS